MANNIRLQINTEQISRRIRQAADRGCLKAAHIWLGEYRRLVLQGPKSGRVYRRGGIAHKASAPGEAPASDLGNLVRSARVRPGPSGSGKATVVIGSQYARRLEFGGGKIKPRPALRPALKNKRREMIAVIRAEMKKAT